MALTEEDVWDQIIKSAKSRFDYSDLELALSDFDEEGRMAENVLTMVVSGIAGEQSDDEILSHINGEFLLLGLRMDSTLSSGLLPQIRSKVQHEVDAMRIAVDLLDSGTSPNQVMEVVAPRLILV